MGKMIGHSLSFCVLSILEGEVEEGDIEKIIASTKIETEGDFWLVMDDYKKNYWGMDPDEGVRIARRLFMDGKIDQPRTRGEDHPNACEDGIWAKEGIT
jgi:hypothetical protein